MIGMHILPLLVVTAATRPDDYSESYREISLGKTGDYKFVELEFEITTYTTKSSHILDIFPSSLASVLFAPRGVTSAQANIVRGQWKPFYWGDTPPIDLHPSGSSMWISGKVSSSTWRKTAFMFSSIFGIAFESMCPEQSQFKWMRPFDMDGMRIASNPNDPCCTENLDRFLELLPCRGRMGLGRVLTTITPSLAHAEFLQMSLKATRTDENAKMTAQIAIVIFSDTHYIPISL